MYAVIFEVQPKSGAIDDYLNIAASLKIELEKIDGFISVERFQSMVNKDKVSEILDQLTNSNKSVLFIIKSHPADSLKYPLECLPLKNKQNV